MKRDAVRERLAGSVPPWGRRTIRSATGVFASATGRFRVLPDFVILGTQRGGTTTLYHYLVRHPQVLGAVADKEVHYFDLRASAGLDEYRKAFPTRGALGRATRRAGDRVLVGEASPYYLFHPAVPGRLRAALPDARLIAVLRDPVERAWSHYRHEVELGYESFPFDEALDREEERLAGQEGALMADAGAVGFEHQHHSYAARGRYAEQIERWWSVFPREQLLLLRSEDMFADPGSSFASVTDFLGLVRRAPVGWKAYNATASRELDPGLRERLTEGFRPWNARLAELTGRDWGWDRVEDS